MIYTQEDFMMLAEKTFTYIQCINYSLKLWANEVLLHVKM